MARVPQEPKSAPARPRRQAPAKAADPAQPQRRQARPMGARMEEATPEIATPVRGGEPAPKVDPSPPFWLVFNPARWDVIGEDEVFLVPALYKATARGGANGCDATKDGKPMPSPMLAQIEENGHTIIPWDVDGKGTSYLRREPQTRGWFTRWETVFPGSQDIRSDVDGYGAWLQSLITRGVLPPPPLYVIERECEEHLKLLTEAKKKSPDGPQAQLYARRLEHLRELLEDARAELGDAEPAQLESGTPDDEIVLED